MSYLWHKRLSWYNKLQCRESKVLCIRTVDEDDNYSTDAQGFLGSGRYLVENKGGCIQIQKRLDTKNGVPPPIILQKKEQQKIKSWKLSVEEVPVIPYWVSARDKKIPGFRYNEPNTNHKWGAFPLEQ